MNILLQSEAASAADLIREILGSPIGSLSFILGIMILSGWLIHFVTKHITKYKTENEENKSKVIKIEDKIDTINTNLAYIRGTIDVVNKIIPNPTIKSKSPISLTELGESLAKDMDLQAKIIRNWDKIRDYLDNNLLQKNAYDIQQFCIDTASVSLDRLFSESDVNNIKEFAFKNGNPLLYYGGMIGVMIRDAYFKYKGIDIFDVDKCEKETKTT